MPVARPASPRPSASCLHRDTLTVTGATLGENYAGAQVWDREVIRPLDNPVKPVGSGIAVLRGNLAPRGAVIKQSAATPDLMVHRGRALVWDSLQAYLADADDPDLDVTADDILIVRNVGPKGYPGMPEVGNMPLPRKILEAGVMDMVRISDARMSGTSYGTVVLHVVPEAAAGGPLALVRTGDIVTLDVPTGRSRWMSTTTSSNGAARSGATRRARQRSRLDPPVRRACRAGRRGPATSTSCRAAAARPSDPRRSDWSHTVLVDRCRPGSWHPAAAALAARGDRVMGVSRGSARHRAGVAASRRRRPAGRRPAGRSRRDSHGTRHLSTGPR